MNMCMYIQQQRTRHYVVMHALINTVLQQAVS